MPQNHFDGVNEWGYVSHWEEIAKIPLQDGFDFPLVINFRSDRAQVSPYLGYGWMLPLLESRFVQVNERKFLMVQPNGVQTYFNRKVVSENVLKSGGGWLAEINGDLITAWAECGWKIAFRRGKIASISTPQGRRIEYIYSGPKVAELRENGKPRLTLEDDPERGFTRAFIFDGKRLEIAFGDKPRVENISGAPVIAGIDKSLTRFQLLDGSWREYRFAVDEKIVPSLTVSHPSQRTYQWDPGTGQIRFDGQWKYVIKPGAQPGDYAEIQRENAAGGTEFWVKDLKRGREVVKWARNDFTEVTTRFAGRGPLVGKVRKVEHVVNGKAKVVQTYAYDDKGQLLRRTTDDGGVTRYSYQSGHLVSAIEEKAGVTISVKKYDQEGRVIERRDTNGKVFGYGFDTKGRVHEETIDGKLHCRRIWSEDGLTMEQQVFAEDGKTLARTFAYQMDASGRRLSQKVTELLREVSPQLTEYQYDDSGRMIRGVVTELSR